MDQFETFDLYDQDFLSSDPEASSLDDRQDNKQLLFNQDYNLNSPILNDSRLDFLMILKDLRGENRSLIALNKREESRLESDLNQLIQLGAITEDSRRKIIQDNQSELLTVQKAHGFSFAFNAQISEHKSAQMYISMVEDSLKQSLELKSIGETYLQDAMLYPDVSEFKREQFFVCHGGIFLLYHALVLAMNSRSEEEGRDALKWNPDILSAKTLSSPSGHDVKSAPTWVIKSETVGVMVLWSEFVLFLDQHLLMNKNQLMMYKDTLLARCQSWISILIDGGKEMEHRLSTLKSLYKLGDKIISQMGTDGYDLIKMIEPLSVSRLQELSDSLKPLFPPFDDFKNHVTEKCMLFDSNAHHLGSDLKDFIFRQDQFETLLDTFSSFRHWGHPFIHYEEGLKKLKEQVRLEKQIDTEYVECLASDLAFKILKSKFSEDKKWYVDASKMDKKNLLYQFVEENTWPNQTVIDRFGDNWHRLPLTQCFEIPELLDPAQIYSDKSHSGTREEVLDYLAKERRGPIRTKKVLKTMLETPERDWKAFFDQIDKYGFAENSLIIGLKGKERELKIIGRYFALLTWDLRDYFVSTEYLIKRFFVPYFSGLTMADDLLGVIKKMLSNAQGQGRNDYEYITIADHIDYEKWNNHQRDESNKSIFRVMDQFLGYNNLISRTHEVFQRSWIYYAGRSDVLERRGNKIVDNTGKNCFFWEGQAGGLEGLRQKGWTTVSFLVVERESRKRNTLVKVLAQGDNQIVTTHFKTRKCRTEGELSECLMEIRRNNDILMKAIVDGTNKLGLIINDDETVKSTDFLIYGKVPIIRSQMKGLSIKRWSRVNCVTNDQLPSLGSVLSSATTNALTTAHFSPSPLNSVKNHLFFCNLGLNLIKQFNPALGRGMDDKSESYKNSFENNLGRAILIYLDPSLGGRCGTNLGRFLIRMFPDPITEGLSFWRILGERTESRGLKRLAAEIGNPELKRRETKDLEKLLEDPTSLNYKKVPSIQGVLKNEVKSSLLRSSHNIKNNIMKLSLRFHAEEETRFIKWLLSIKPLFPKFLSECYGASFHGLVKSLIGLFANSKSIRNICRVDYKGNLSRIVQNFEEDILRSTSDLVRRAERSHRSLWACSSTLADELRRRSWGDEVIGMTIPHPSELLESPRRSDECQNCQGNAGTTYLTLLCPEGIPQKKTVRGPFEPYLGSTTSEGTSILTPWEKETSVPLIRKAEKLRNCISWFVRPDGNVSKSILNNLQALTGENWDQDLHGYQRTGSALHRFGCSRVSSGGFCASSPENPSWVVMTSDTLGSINERNYDFMYQSLFIYSQAKLFLNSKSAEPGIWHAHLKCQDCLREIPEIFLESDFEFCFRDVHHFLEKWVPRIKDTITERSRDVNLISEDWTCIKIQKKSYYVGKIMGYLYGDRILNKVNSVEESSLYPLSIRNKLDPPDYLKGICHGVMIAAGLSILLRRNVIKGKRIDQALMGSSSWVINELAKSEKFIHFLSGSTILKYLIRLPHKPIASYPPNSVELGYMFRTKCLKIIERLINDPSSHESDKKLFRNIWIFSDIQDGRIIGSLVIGSLMNLKTLRIHKKTETDWMRQIQKMYVSLMEKTGTDLHPMLGIVLNSLNIYRTESEIRHCMKEEPDQVLLESPYDFEGEEAYGYVLKRDLEDLLLSPESQSEEEDDPPAPKIQNPLISSLRLVQLSTGAHYKLRSLIKTQGIDFQDFMCLGDGSGGMTSCLLRLSKTSRGIFNSLLDLSTTPLRGMKPGPPSAVLELGGEADRCVNHLTCWEHPSNLCYSSTWRYFDSIIYKSELDINLIVIDAEFREVEMARKIEDNLISFLSRWNKRTTVIYKTYYDRVDERKSFLMSKLSIFKKINFCVTEFTSSGSSEIYLLLEFDPSRTLNYRTEDFQKIRRELRQICFCFKSPLEEFKRGLKIAREKDLLSGVPARILPDGLEELISVMTYYGVESGHSMKLAGDMRKHQDRDASWLSVIFALASNKHLNWSHYPETPRWCSDGEAKKILCFYVSALFVLSIWTEDPSYYLWGEQFMKAGGNIQYSDRKVKITPGKTRHDVKGLYLDDKMSLIGGTIRCLFLCFGREARRGSARSHDSLICNYNAGCRSKNMGRKLELPKTFWD
ncbi:polymerase [Iriri virus]|uniref:Replicase n=1 Tax=Iriri virus TaxID=1620893 RepID=A0A0D3R144_9RHAB|nr:polymerase [Iriri virus]AJR28373.1 polymerase [Iriri virus]